MERRRFGRTGHMSTVAILGGFVLSEAEPSETDEIMRRVLQFGVNHIDIAPSYGHAETQLGPWMEKTNTREQFFLGCKTMERNRDSALIEMRQSLEQLKTQYFDLYQIHAITTMAELDEVTKPGGALEALIEAREMGLTKYLGITGHGLDAPVIFSEALRRFDFDTVLFPLNFIQYANPHFRENTNSLIQECRKRDVGTMTIKSITKGPWGDKQQTHNTWYEPLTEMEEIQKAVNFVLSQDITGLCTVGDPNLLPKVLHACENFSYISMEEQKSLVDTAAKFEPLFS